MNKYEIVKFVDDEVKLDVNISPLEKQYGLISSKYPSYSKGVDR